MRTDRRKLIRQRILPASYERLNYIENTSMAYIDCGLQPKYTFDYEFKGFCFSGNTVVGYLYNQDYEQYRFFYVNNRFYFDVGSQRISVYVGLIPDIKYYHVKFGNYYIKSLDPEGFETSGATFNETMNGTNLHNLLLLYNGTSKYMLGKICFFKIKDRGKFIRDFIPVKRKSDGVIGMYDLVGRKFYTSPNGVAFTGG